ncbi:YjbH domain-containing protein [Pusillimonas minor]|uniref:YjbH domain-containing protein n=1 Tax=Pusillimonas minor TaxID=2697024 RepID=A0A842HNH0_9BURK|nr:YjbH domain-containing protein [Pusillimonas minor]MBC2769833.1 YjbH domain-containing protein [Pusillimonas minor]
MRSTLTVGRLPFLGFSLLAIFLLLVALGAAQRAAASESPTSLGLTGLINMPSGRMAEDGMLYMGFSRSAPYGAAYGVMQALPGLQVSGRYTRISGVQGFQNNTDYGSYKDKAFGFKLRLLPENAFGLGWMPEVSVGAEDIHGTALFRSEFIAATKRVDLGVLGNVDATVGYGRKRIDGPYAGLRYRHKSLPSWALVAEYDRTAYNRDPFAASTGLSNRKPGRLGVGLEYTWGALTLQATRNQDQYGFNLSLALPLQGTRSFVPNINEAGPFAGGAWASAAPRPTAAQWETDRQFRQNLLVALHQEGLRNVRVAWHNGVMSLSVSSNRYRYASRGVGRAARIAMAYAPFETQTLEITWETRGVAGMTWTFFDVPTLQRYFMGTATRSELAHAVTLSYANPNGRFEASRRNDLNAMLDELAFQQSAGTNFDWGLARVQFDTHDQTSFTLAPSFSSILNDPSGIFKYDLGLTAALDVNLGQGLWFEGAVRASVLETISDISQQSNSTLPHVRSDAPLYRQASRYKLDRLLLNQLWHPSQRVYTRASFGLYEEMFGGFGAQALYLSGGRWAADVSVDILRQRNYKGTGFLSYRTHQIMASGHYRLPWVDGLTATVRAGRFLAGDLGARFELTRTFKSGLEVGVWYTHTNGNDITSPGSPGNPYQDKGVFVRIPLGTLLTNDSGASASFSLSPWNRDVGRMVNSPADLYQMAEKGWLENARDGDGLRGISDIPPEDTP